ncbi:hypothetical protein [Botryobacter ruber]|uniref:hypothetical protein n=1 Tax=Botryobacter ruber TaxID=2171629 RepID=UPI000F64A026|nr:hypothetical protein [Botryobacter ruber]
MQKNFFRKKGARRWGITGVTAILYQAGAAGKFSATATTVSAPELQEAGRAVKQQTKKHPETKPLSPLAEAGKGAEISGCFLQLSSCGAASC